jgi:cell division protein FtsW
MKWTLTILGWCVAALLALGIVMLFSAMMGPAQKEGNLLIKQLAFCGVGLVMFVVMMVIDYRALRPFAWIVLLISMVLLALVLVPGIGIKVWGAKRWLPLGPVRIQPSEFAKLAFILALAHYGALNRARMSTLKWGLLVPLLILASVIGLIFKEPDWGTTFLLVAVCMAMLVLAGSRLIYLAPLVPVGMVIVYFMVLHDPVRLARVKAYMDQEGSKQGTGYQAYQAKIALGAGGWDGLGLGNGRQKMGFVPMNHTDFILSVIGEEVGLKVTLGIVVVYILVIFCGAFIAWNASDSFGFLLASGLTFMIGFQAFINIGVVTSVLPNKGMGLPFISYGGSNLVLLLMSIGLLFSIARRSGEEGDDSDGFGEPAAATVPF